MTKKKRKYFIGIDLGGTKLLAAVLDKKFDIVAASKSKNEPNLGEKVFFKMLEDCVEEALDEAKVNLKEVAAIGMGCPGIIQRPEGVVKLSPNISFLKNYRLQDRLKRTFKVPAVIENDANAGLYGEQQFGAARGYDHVVGIFMGTGVGGALILDGKLYRGATGAAGEIGHTFIDLPSFGHTEESRSTLEGMTGRLAISSQAALLVMRQLAPRLHDEVGYDVRKIKSKMLLKAIQSGDAAVRDLIVSKARLVGLSMANVVNLLSPELFVLGGGMVEALGGIIVNEARDTMKKLAMGPLVHGVKVVPAKLGDYAIVKGAAKLAFDALGGKGGRR